MPAATCPRSSAPAPAPSAFEPRAAPRGRSFPRPRAPRLPWSPCTPPPVDQPVLAVRALTGGPSPASPAGHTYQGWTPYRGVKPGPCFEATVGSHSCHLRRRPALLVQASARHRARSAAAGALTPHSPPLPINAPSTFPCTYTRSPACPPFPRCPTTPAQQTAAATAPGRQRPISPAPPRPKRARESAPRDPGSLPRPRPAGGPPEFRPDRRRPPRGTQLQRTKSFWGSECKPGAFW
jgi:hypothetical protein